MTNERRVLWLFSLDFFPSSSSSSFSFPSHSSCSSKSFDVSLLLLIYSRFGRADHRFPSVHSEQSRLSTISGVVCVPTICTPSQRWRAKENETRTENKQKERIKKYQKYKARNDIGGERQRCDAIGSSTCRTVVRLAHNFLKGSWGKLGTTRLNWVKLGKTR